ncbi:MAG: hypothetical protein AAB368_10220, partial [bacterium]
ISFSTAIRANGPAAAVTAWVPYDYTASSTDPKGDRVGFGWDWDGDGKVDDWTGLVASGTSASLSHVWPAVKRYLPRVKAKDEYGGESDWSSPLEVTAEFLASLPAGAVAVAPNLLDRSGMTCAVGFHPTSSGSTQIKVFTISGRPVRQGSTTDSLWVFDGKDGGGNDLAAG